MPRPCSARSPTQVPSIRSRALPTPQLRKNDLKAGVGFLELANACDFAANVWNEIPVPPQAVALMASGGAVALFILHYAYVDARLSYRNTRLLLQERRELRAQLRGTAPEDPAVRELQTYLNINFRELGTELIDRVGMDILLGFGALLVGIGTFLAIDGANPRMYRASNIMTGYLGNVPPSLFGLVNAAWAWYTWRRAQHQARCASSAQLNSVWGERVDVDQMLQRHTHRVRTHSILNGVYGILGGIGSLMTADCNNNPSLVWAYFVLLPCIVGAVFANYYWRHKIGYDRDLSEREPLSRAHLLNEVGFAGENERLLTDFQRASKAPRPWFHPPPATPNFEPLFAYLTAYQTLQIERHRHRQQQGEAVAGEVDDGLAELSRDLTQDAVAVAWAQRICDFAVENDLYAALLAQLLANPTIANTLREIDPGLTAINHDTSWDHPWTNDDTLFKDPVFVVAFFVAAQEFMCTVGISHFRNRERNLVELLGIYLHAEVVRGPQSDHDISMSTLV